MAGYLADENFRSAVNAAMEACDGDLMSASQMCGIEYEKFKAIVKRDDILHTRWCRTEGPRKFTDDVKPAQTFTRDTAEKLMELTEDLQGDVMTEDQKDLAKLALVEDRKVLKHGLAGLKLKTDEMELGLALQEFQGASFKGVFEIMGGGLVRSQLQILCLLDRKLARLEKVQVFIDGMEMKDKDRQNALKEERTLTNDIAKISENVRLNYETYMKASYLLAVARNRSGNANNKPQKPGYGKGDSEAELEANAA